MKESRQIQIQANLSVKNGSGTEILIDNDTNQDLVIRVKSNSTPSFPLSMLKKGWQMRGTGSYLAQGVKLLFNEKPILSIISGKISYQSPFFLLKVLIKSIFR